MINTVMTPTTRFGFRKEHLLMPNRVRDVLLVSSRYDAFVLEEDGHLSEQIFVEYRSLSLSSAPRFTHVTSGQAAFELLTKRRFDMVLIVAREASDELLAFVREVKRLQPDQTVVVLGFESADLSRLKRSIDPDAVDAIFVWNGDAKILLAIIKHIEDRANVDNDILVAGVRVILVVEDSIGYYSSFLAALYPELMKQSHSLFFEGLNRLQRLLRMRTRPKVLHAKTYEEALQVFEAYRDNMLALISDVGFPRGGQRDPEAGLALTRLVRAELPDLPVLLQSADRDYLEEADRLDVQFVTKHSPTLLHTVRQFLVDYLGFGPFIFRMPDGAEVARAGDVRELADCIRTVPGESLEYHARRNHVSNWLMARSEFELAEIMKPQKVGDFDSIEEMREFTLGELEARFRQVRQGVIADFSMGDFDPQNLFQRIGEGSLGGKARGIAFLNHLITSDCGSGQLAGLKIQIPQTFVVTTDAFEQFIENNRLDQITAENSSDEQILARFLASRLPDEMVSNLRVILRHMEGPLAIRSSSLLEDDMLHPFAGIYGTVMISNLDPDPAARLADLCKAIKTVYATTFYANARAYVENTAHRVEEERMGVIIQRVIGRRHGDRFYPDFAGVAHSYNYYPMGPLKAEDGVAQAVLGLGRLVVDGGESFRFCPRHPGVLPQFANPGMVLKNSQRRFYALDLTRDWQQEDSGYTGNQVLYDLPRAQKDGTFRAVGSVYDAPNDRITENFLQEGPLVVTFNNILKHHAIPLAPALTELLSIVTDAVATPVELEFACDMGNWGKDDRRDTDREPPVFYPLQVRPILSRQALYEVRPEQFEPERIICRSTRTLGNGHFTDIRDVVYVKHESFEPARSRDIAREVGQVNAEMVRNKRPFVLIGPGRWGSADHWLGIPVQWSQISNARIIIEASPEGYNVEPSQGTHFFHNLTALGLGYFTIPPGADRDHQRNGSFVDWQWLADQPAVRETEHLRHVAPPVPLVAYLDGRNSLGLIAWCAEPEFS